MRTNIFKSLSPRRRKENFEDGRFNGIKEEK